MKVDNIKQTTATENLQGKSLLHKSASGTFGVIREKSPSHHQKFIAPTHDVSKAETNVRLLNTFVSAEHVCVCWTRLCLLNTLHVLPPPAGGSSDPRLLPRWWKASNGRKVWSCRRPMPSLTNSWKPGCRCLLICETCCVFLSFLLIRVQCIGVVKEPSPQIFKICSHFLLWGTASQTKYCCSPEIKHSPPNFGRQRHWFSDDADSLWWCWWKVLLYGYFQNVRRFLSSCCLRQILRSVQALNPNLFQMREK